MIRAIKSIAQTALASIGTASVVLSEFDWGFILMTSGMAGIISLLMSFERIPEEDLEVKAIAEQPITQTTSQTAITPTSQSTDEAAGQKAITSAKQMTDQIAGQKAITPANQMTDQIAGRTAIAPAGQTTDQAKGSTLSENK